MIYYNYYEEVISISYYMTNPFTDISTFSIQGRYNYDQKNVLFLIVLQGELSALVNDISFTMSRGDILMLTSGDSATFIADGTNMIQRICITSEFLNSDADTLIGHYTCNSVLDTERDYTELRRLLAQISINGIYNSRMRQIKTIELAYTLLYYLNTHHYQLQTVTTDKYNERTNYILSYIESNYMKNISLETLSSITKLSIAYLSRFFKKSTGKNFIDYLRDVRIKHALRALTETDQKIIDLALENGFSSATTFNRIFKNQFGVSPVVYRKNHKSLPAAISEIKKLDSDHQHLAHKLLTQLSGDVIDPSSPIVSQKSRSVSYPTATHYSINANGRSRKIDPIWRQAINIGFINTITNSVLQAQLIKAQQEIGFRYGRLEGVLNPDIITRLNNGKYNFAYFDRYIEMLQSVNMIPYLDLTNRENYYFTSDLRSIHKENRNPKHTHGLHADTEKIETLIRHCINTFGMDEVEKWIFEIGLCHDEYLNPTESAADFALRFKLNQRFIHNLLPDALVGGFAYNAALGPALFNDILTEFEKIHCSPDFLSISIFPYDIVREEKSNITAYSMLPASSPDFALDQFSNLTNCLDNHPNITRKMFISSIGTDIINQNPINDCCFQSTYFAKIILDFIGIADIVTYWQLSDLGSDIPNIDKPLYGGTGIISKDSLPKPGYIMLKNFSSFHDELIQKGKDYLICSHTKNNYTMAFINFAYPDKQLDTIYHTTLTMSTVYSVFEDSVEKYITVGFCGLPTGNYKLITTSINRQHGSLLDHMLDYGSFDNLHPEDINNIREMTHPQTHASYMNTSNGSLTIHLHLKPHEVVFCKLVRTL